MPPSARVSAGLTDADPTIVENVDAARWERLTLAPGVIAAVRPTADAHDLLTAGLRDGATVSAAVAGATVVGVVASRAGPTAAHDLLAVGVAPPWRRRGLGGSLLAAHVASTPTASFTAEITVGERDPSDPLDRHLRTTVARRLFERAGFRIVASAPEVQSADPGVVTAELMPSGGTP